MGILAEEVQVVPKVGRAHIHQIPTYQQAVRMVVEVAALSTMLLMDQVPAAQ